jgi:hypothetical protein
MEQMTQSAGARAQFVLTDAYAREMYRSIRPRVLIILGIVFFVPVLVYCITKIAWRALFSYVTGAAFLEGVSMWLAVALLLAYLVGFIWLLFAPRRRAKHLVRRMHGICALEAHGEFPGRTRHQLHVDAVSNV